MNKKVGKMIVGSMAAVLLISGGIASSSSISNAWAAATDTATNAAPNAAAEGNMDTAASRDKPEMEAGRQRGSSGADGKRHDDKGGPGGRDCINEGTGGVKAGPPAAPTGTNPSTGTTTDNANVENAVGSVVISGGFDTDPVDHGRPVVLIAAALGVPTEVFREAFSGVTPAGGDGGPSSELAQRNKAALLSVLTPYGITNERLDEVSNYYRYNGRKGETWTHTQATASAIITDGVVTGVTITNAGSGYSSNPTVTITGPDGPITATAAVSYTEDFATNGSISAITID